MQAAAVPGLYSHIAPSDDHDANDIPKTIKSTKGRGSKKFRKGKQKQQQQQQLQQQQHQQLPPPSQEEEMEQYDETGNYYHNDNYRGNNKGCRPFRDQGGSRRPFRGSNPQGRGQSDNFRSQHQSNRG